MKNIGYLQCQKGGYHTGEFLNIVCLQSACKNNILCCCACIEQYHQNHRTKTLKKILMECDTLSKNIKNQPKKQVKKIGYNTDIMMNIIQNYEKDVLTEFGSLKKSFLKQIDLLETNVMSYYKKFYKKLTKCDIQDKDLKVSLLQQIENVQGSNTIQKLKENVSILLNTYETAEFSVQNSSISEIPDEESYLNFIKNSNIEVNEIIQKKLKKLYELVQNQNKKLNVLLPRIQSYWQNQLFKFSPELHNLNMSMPTSFSILAHVDSIYQAALMTPSLSFKNQIQTFRFRINAIDLQWAAVGVCYKNIVQKNNFELKYEQNGHGFYLISGNGGSWSHSQIDFNNTVKSFRFKQGDCITCAVYKDRICFIKQIPSQHQFSQQYSQRQYYQLIISPQPHDQLHPCVVSYYKNTQIQYLPSFSSQLKHSDLPVFKYKFSNKFKHPNIILINDIYTLGLQPVAYKCCIMDNPMEDNGPINQLKSVTFRITRSTNNWIGLGVCHKNIIVNNQYQFNFAEPGHGCYMISSNGGSWSHIDNEANNIVKTFNFIEGDLVTCILDQKNKKVIFKRGINSYQLPYQPINNDKLYPVVVLYYNDDQVQVLPQF